MTHYALLAALLVRLTQRDADVAALEAAAAARPRPQPRMLRALSVPGPPRPRAADAKAPEPPAAPLMSAPTSALTSSRAAAPNALSKETSVMSIPKPQRSRAAAAERADHDAAAAVDVTSPWETSSVDPCTPSKEPVPLRAPNHQSSAARGVPSASGGQVGVGDVVSACKRLCMEDAAPVSEAEYADRWPGSAAEGPEAVGQLSSAVSTQVASGDSPGVDKAVEHNGMSAGRGSDLPDAVHSAPADQQQNWKLLAAKAEKPLVMCAECAMPPTPEKHALVQVIPSLLEITQCPLFNCWVVVVG